MIIIDNQIINNLINESLKPESLHLNTPIIFKWPSLLEYLGWGSLYSTLPAFDSNNPLFIASIATLSANEEKENVFYIYDRLFAESLNQIKNLPQITSQNLLQAIQDQSIPSELQEFLTPTLSAYEIALSENPAHTMHDLILYLGWDRMCMWIGQLFNYQCADQKFIAATTVLKECLIESYDHITKQGRTSPGFYRMMEALLFYEMREENIQNHTDEEWALLSRSFPVLKNPEELADFFYIDDAIISQSSPEIDEKDSVYLTQEHPEKIHQRISLAQHILKRLHVESADWDYVLKTKQIRTI